MTPNVRIVEYFCSGCGSRLLPAHISRDDAGTGTAWCSVHAMFLPVLRLTTPAAQAVALRRAAESLKGALS